MGRFAVPISILLGFAVLSGSVLLKRNNFESCVAAYDELLPDDHLGANRRLGIVSHCLPK
jgi:hypothetical protein